MSNKLVARYDEIEAEFEGLQQMVTRKAGLEIIRERLIEVEAKQADLKKTVLHLIALSKLRDEAWRTLSYGMDA
jgi:hypothetical protein